MVGTSTAYTHDVQTGKISDFKTFAMLCARAMSPAAIMRDQPLDAPIPDKFKPDPKYLESANKARAALARLEGMTAEEISSAAALDYTNGVADWATRETERAEENRRVREMLDHVRAWSPSDEIVPLRKFMIDQLSLVIDTHKATPPAQISSSEWLSERRTALQSDIEYWSAGAVREASRCFARNKWFNELRKSLEDAS